MRDERGDDGFYLVDDFGQRHRPIGVVREDFVNVAKEQLVSGEGQEVSIAVGTSSDGFHRLIFTSKTLPIPEPCQSRLNGSYIRGTEVCVRGSADADC